MSFITLEDGAQIRLSDFGSGQPIVLVHGWNMSHRAWDKVVAQLSTNFRVISYDLLGMGESDKPPIDYNFERYADDLNNMLELLDLNDVTLVGWSMGCTISLSYLQKYNNRISRLVLVSGPVKLVADTDFQFGIDKETVDRVISDLAKYWPEQQRKFIESYLHTPYPETVNWHTQIALQTPLYIALKIVREQCELDLRPVLEKLRIPVMALYGRHDPYYSPLLAEWIANTAAKGQFSILENSAHYSPIEETTRFVELISSFIKHE